MLDALDPYVGDDDPVDMATEAGRYKEIAWLIYVYHQFHIPMACYAYFHLFHYYVFFIMLDVFVLSFIYLRFFHYIVSFLYYVFFSFIYNISGFDNINKLQQ